MAPLLLLAQSILRGAPLLLLPLLLLPASGRRAKDRGRRAETRERRAEDWGRRAETRGRRAEARGRAEATAHQSGAPTRGITTGDDDKHAQEESSHGIGPWLCTLE